jgi:hypothetical protein
MSTGIAGGIGAGGPAAGVESSNSLPQPPSGHGIVLIGPSGAGKSHLLRSALDHHQAGIALLAPGDDELESYRALEGRESYRVLCFEDPAFYPTVGRYDVEGHMKLVQTLAALFTTNRTALTSTGSLKYPVIVVDTWSGIDQLVVSAALSKARMSSMPPAQSPKGGEVYGTIKLYHREVMRGVRANRALGAHILVACHIIERDAESALAAAGSSPIVMPALTGSFRDSFLASFNLSLHVNKTHDPAWPSRHFVQINSDDPSKLTKVRYRAALSSEKRIKNDWSVLLPMLDAARAREEGEAEVRSEEEEEVREEVREP